MIHRSNAARELCKQTETVAQQSGARQWTATHMLTVLLDDTPDEVADVFASAGIKRSRPDIATPFIDQWCQDISPNPGALKDRAVPNGVDFPPAAKIVTRAILSERATAILLIKKGSAAPLSVVEHSAHIISEQNQNNQKKNIRFVRLSVGDTSWQSMGEVTHEMKSNFFRLMDEIKTAGNVVLYIDGLDILIGKASPKRSSGMLDSLLILKGINLIVGIEEKNYDAFIKTDPEWRKMFEPVWIHDILIRPDRL